LAQSPIYTKLGEETFWNKDIYTLFYEENSEVIYVGTNDGLFIYKENKFTRLTGPENQLGFSFFNLQQDKKGDIFCNNLNGQIFKINPQKHNYELYYQLDKNDTKGGRLWCYFTPENNLFIASKFSFKILNHNKEIIQTNADIKHIDIGQIIVTKQVDQSIYIEYYKKNKNSKLHLCAYENGKTTFIDSINHKKNESSSGFLVHNGKPFSINKSGTLNYNQTIVSEMEPQELERYNNLSDTSVIALNSKNGYRSLILLNDTLKASKLILPNTFISAFFKTNSGQYLLGTFGDGILLVSNPEIQKNEHDYLFLDLAVSPSNKVAISTRSGEILQTNKGKLTTFYKSGHHIDHVFFVGENKQFADLGFQDFVFADKNRIAAEIKDIKIISDDLILYSTYSGVTAKVSPSFSSKFKIPQHDILLKNERFNCLEWDSKDSIIYYSTNMGVFSNKWLNQASTPLLFNNKTFSVNDLIFVNDKLFCATNKHGVLVYKGQKFIEQIQVSNKNSLVVKQILFHLDRLFILTNNGLKLYDLEKKEFIEINNESVYERVTDMALSTNKLWLLEKHACFSVDLDVFKETKITTDSLKIFINNIQVNNKSIDWIPDLSFPYNQNRFEFTYDYRDIFNKNKTQILYKLEGLNEDWKIGSPLKNNILFQSLPPGDYTFKIKAQYNHSTSKTQSFSFMIRPPIWQTWWFYSAFISLAILFVSFYYRKRISKIKKEEALRLEKHKLLTNSIQSELKAIRAQMNPHFIFNAINSIQDLVLQNDTLKSYDALVQFSKLVRNTLDYSEKEFIYLSQEIDFLETYLGLEQLRFKTNFDYNIQNFIQGDLRIPSIIIQPFVENAIKHGLLHKSGQKQLNITFNLIDEQIICTITDNGIGIKKSQEIKSRQNRNHKSFSTNAISKRLQILEQKLEQKCYFTSEEIIGEQEMVIGTKIKVFLPVLD